jgi:hypothetical protein
MSLRKSIIEVLKLQKKWTDKSTDAMKRRGKIIRSEIPKWLSKSASAISRAMGRSGADLDFEGGDGTGRKTEVPWVRLYSTSRSPNPRTGWYVVLLFSADGSGAYLCLQHGATTWENGEFRPKPEQELTALVNWARSQLDTAIISERYVTDIDLRAKGDLASAYERGTAYAIYYSRDAIPTAKALLDDIKAMATLLSKLYDAQDFGREPGAEPPDVALLLAAAEDISRGSPRGHSTGQGFGLSAPERHAIELHAMKIAGEALVADGFSIKDTSKNKPYDFEATKKNRNCIVEVKGTTAQLSSILLTVGEVRAHNREAPQNILIVVSEIELTGGPGDIVASGGTMTKYDPWVIDEAKLRPLTFQYVLKDGD